MNQGQVKNCAGCNGEHISDEKQSTPAAEGGRRYYCGTCWPDVAGTDALRLNNAAAARLTAFIQHGERIGFHAAKILEEMCPEPRELCANPHHRALHALLRNLDAAEAAGFNGPLS